MSLTKVIRFFSKGEPKYIYLGTFGKYVAYLSVNRWGQPEFYISKKAQPEVYFPSLPLCTDTYLSIAYQGGDGTSYWQTQYHPEIDVWVAVLGTIVVQIDVGALHKEILRYVER